MSFKRDGNDFTLLSLQKKRRVDEVLGTSIPDDEVAVMSDGKLTCVVCNAVPIFDNIEILKIHRNTHKHKQKFQEFTKNKKEKLNIIEKRLHVAKQKGEDTSELLKKKSELLNKSKLAKSGIQSKKWQPKTKVQLDLSENLTATNEELRHKATTSKQSVSRSSALSRTDCLNKVACTVQSPALEKLKSLSKLSEAERKKVRERESYLKSSGWICNKDGEWVKDPNVEFDSDEEVNNT